MAAGVLFIPDRCSEAWKTLSSVSQWVTSFNLQPLLLNFINISCISSFGKSLSLESLGWKFESLLAITKLFHVSNIAWRTLSILWPKKILLDWCGACFIGLWWVQSWNLQSHPWSVQIVNCLLERFLRLQLHDEKHKLGGYLIVGLENTLVKVIILKWFRFTLQVPGWLTIEACNCLYWCSIIGKSRHHKEFCGIFCAVHIDLVVSICEQKMAWLLQVYITCMYMPTDRPSASIVYLELISTWYKSKLKIKC